MKTLSLLVGALLLLAYPFFALACFVNLVAARNSSMGAVQYGCGITFSLTVLLYPLAYLIALLLTLTNRKDEIVAGRMALIPLWYFLGIVLLTFCWIGAEKAHL